MNIVKQFTGLKVLLDGLLVEAHIALSNKHMHLNYWYTCIVIIIVTTFCIMGSVTASHWNEDKKDLNIDYQQGTSREQQHVTRVQFARFDS